MLQNLERQSWYLGNLAGIPIFVHWTAIALVFMSWGPAAPALARLGCNDVESSILILIALVVGILLHELGHGLTSRALGGFGLTITLWAFGGLCRSTRDAARAGREVAIVAAGPIVSLILWQGAYWTIQVLLQHAPGMLEADGGYSLLYQFLTAMEIVNFSLLMFNILPIYPLDGGQFVYQGMRLLVGDRLIVRQVSLTIAVLGAIAYFCWSTGLFTVLDIPGGVQIWLDHLQNNLGSVAIRVILLGFLLRNAFLVLA